MPPPETAERTVREILSVVLDADGFQLDSEKHSETEFKFQATRKLPKDKDRNKLDISFLYGKAAEGFDPNTSLSRFIGPAALTPKWERCYLVMSNGEFSPSARESATSFDPTDFELYDLDDLSFWIRRSLREEEFTASEIFLTLQGAWIRCIEVIARNPEELWSLEWRTLEHALAEALQSFGIVVELTPGSRDGGKDLILSGRFQGSDQSYVVEVKHWRAKKVGQDVVRKLLEVTVQEARTGGLFLSSSGFTGEAVSGLLSYESKPIYGGDKDKIVSIFRAYEKATAGLWRPSKDLFVPLLDGTIGPGTLLVEQ